MATIATAERAPANYGNLQHTALSAFWFGSNFLWIPLTTVLIQAQVDEVVPKGSQNTAIGVALGIGGLLAMTVPPIVGAWSDRLNTRYGRRRPIMVAGTLLTIPGLLILMAANNYPEIVIGYAIIQFFFNAAGAAYAGIIPDVVPAQQVGKASGFLATMTQLGIGGGLGVTSVLGSNRAIYLIFMAVILLTLIPTIWAARNEGLAPLAPPPKRSMGEAIREFLRPLHEGDFAWVVFTRLMISAGITAVHLHGAGVGAAGPVLVPIVTTGTITLAPSSSTAADAVHFLSSSAIWISFNVGTVVRRGTRENPRRARRTARP